MPALIPRDDEMQTVTNGEKQGKVKQIWAKGSSFGVSVVRLFLVLNRIGDKAALAAG